MLHRFCLTALAATALLTSTAYADCKSDIQDILKSMETSGPYRLEMTTESNGATTIMAGEIAMPDSMHVKGNDMEMTLTPNGVWMASGGTLQKMPDSMKEQVAMMIRQGIDLGVESVAAAECLGSTKFEDGTYDHYKYDASANFMGIATTSVVDLYVDGDGKPRWTVVVGEAMGQKSKSKQHITFDPGIVIADPQ